MRIRILIGLTTVMSLGLAAPSSAQIITTIRPVQRLTSQQPGGAPSGGARPVSFHVMGGYTNWRFGFIDNIKVEPGGTVTGGRNGFIGAADFAVRVGDAISVGAGGWLNKVENLVITEPDSRDLFGFTDTQTISVYSVYGNVFYKHFGVQAGFVPIQSEETVVINNGNTLVGDASQTDMDVFAVGRFSSTRPEQRPWSAMVGAGLYRYGTRAANDEFGNPESPKANAFTAFANGSVGIYKGLSLDVSLWYTAKDKNYTPTSDIGNAKQTRFTVGVGYGR